MPLSFNQWLKNRFGDRTYLESIASLSKDNQAFVIHEAPHTRIKEVPSQQFAFLQGAFVDLGFENLGLSQDLQSAIYNAFVGSGVKIPGTQYKLRYHGAMGFTIIEPSQGKELELPINWKQGVVVVNDKDQFTWIGKRVRKDQIGNVDLSQYKDMSDGWELS